MTIPNALARIDLTETERKEYNKWRLNKGTPLPVQAALRAYELFLSQYTCDEIARASGYPLGQIVDARVRYEWDDVRTEQMRLLYSRIEERALIAKSNAISHVSDLIAASVKLQGDNLKKYLLEGDPTVLGMDLTSIKSFKEICNLLVVLTQQNNSKVSTPSNKVKVEGKVEHVHKSEQTINSTASDLLKELEDAEIIS